ncbi:hypothetical protein [Mesobacillus harenae]|uniref:hypothetical protein n=1 Tax=Mesobacillus harenae TaxID=2213203 RepID=UPI001580E4D9|nr:hypothetical protein [Mesobacillus harenae]
MPQWIVWFLAANLALACTAYFFLYPRRKRIGFHLGMNIAMTAGGGLALGTGVILINVLPLHYKEVTIAAALTGIIAGALFGALFDYQTILSGYINGLMMGLMAPMVGAAASEGPLFIIFIELFITSCFILLLASANRS